MTTEQYQKESARTLINDPGFDLSGKEMMILWCAIGLAGETGEVVDAIKKQLLHQHGLDVDELKKEMGDVLWYLAGICTTMGIDMGEVMQGNIDKLKARYPDGWDAEKSKNRIQ